MKIKDYISPRAFWDAQYDKLDFIENSQFIIERVFNYGKWLDIIRVIVYYGDDTVIKSLLKSDNLTDLGLLMASTIFKIDKTKFKCYTNKPYRPSSAKH